MIIDKQNLLSNDQAIVASAASESVIDLGNDAAAVQALNEKGFLEINIAITAAFNTLTTLTFALQSDDDEAFGSATTIWSKAVALADLALGDVVSVPPLPLINEQYLRLYYTVGGSNPSTGAVHAALVLDKQSNGI